MEAPSPPWTGRTKTIVLIALAIVLAGFLAFISQSFTRVIIAALLAFVASYPIRGLDRLGLRHALSVVVAYIGVIAVTTLLLVFGIPALIRSLTQIDWTGIIESIAAWIVDALESVRFIELFGTTYDLSGVIDPVIEIFEEADPGAAVEVDIERLLNVLSSGAGVLVGIASLLVGFIVEFFTILVLAVYFSIFLPDVREGIPSLVPAAHRRDIDRLLDRMWLVLDMYASGMVRVGLFIATLTWLGLWALGVPGAFFLGAIAGVLNIIPTLGPILAGVPGTFVALIQGSERWDMSNLLFAVLVIVWYFVVQQVESQFATPRIMGGAVQTSPLTVFLGVIIGLQVAGILGALVAVPLVLVAREVFRYAHAKLLDEDPFPSVDSVGDEGGGAGGEADEPLPAEA